MASYKQAVEFAYDALQDFARQSKEEEVNGTGANCHKLIMMFRYAYVTNIITRSHLRSL